MSGRSSAKVTFTTAVLLSAVTSLVDPFESTVIPSSDEAYLAGLNECTTGLALGSATRDGRPLLWKNRDVGNSRQEFHYFDDGRIPFISITYEGETDEYYGGVNALGFAVENSNSYNLPAGGYGQDDDGVIHREALATCRTVDDFQHFLDSTNSGEGRTLNSNYGTIDAFGNAAMFETYGHGYARYDAAEAPGGFLIRSNYSYSSLIGNARSSGWGPHRHDAAYARFQQAVERNTLTALYVFQNVVRDISIAGVDPYPLPFAGYVDNNAYGCIPNGEAVCRSTTRGVLVVQGVAVNQRPEDAVLWAMVGSQLTAVATPLWVRAGSVPSEYRSEHGSRINHRTDALTDFVYNNQGAVNTWRLTNPQRTGIWDYTLPLERWVFDKTERFLSSPQFSYDRLAAFQNEMAQQVADSLEMWKPHYVTNDIVAHPINGGLVLHWVAPEGVPGRDAPERYKVFKSPAPFREGETGVLLGETAELSWQVDNLPRGQWFFRVEGVF